MKLLLHTKSLLIIEMCTSFQEVKHLLDILHTHKHMYVVS